MWAPVESWARRKSSVVYSVRLQPPPGCLHTTRAARARNSRRPLLDASVHGASGGGPPKTQTGGGGGPFWTVYRSVVSRRKRQTERERLMYACALARVCAVRVHKIYIYVGTRRSIKKHDRRPKFLFSHSQNASLSLSTNNNSHSTALPPDRSPTRPAAVNKTRLQQHTRRTSSHVHSCFSIGFYLFSITVVVAVVVVVVLSPRTELGSCCRGLRTARHWLALSTRLVNNTC